MRQVVVTIGHEKWMFPRHDDAETILGLADRAVRVIDTDRGLEPAVFGFEWSFLTRIEFADVLSPPAEYPPASVPVNTLF